MREKVLNQREERGNQFCFKDFKSNFNFNGFLLGSKSDDLQVLIEKRRGREGEREGEGLLQTKQNANKETPGFDFSSSMEHHQTVLR